MNKSISINAKAAALLKQLADSEGVSVRAYVEALTHYAVSCDRRPGSWEGCSSFDFETYDRRNEMSCADRWF